MSKTGVSPLIATVLVIGFVVALGAITMLWGVDFIRDIQVRVEETSQKDIKCTQDVGINTKEIKLLETGELRLTIENTGKTGIDSLNIRVKGHDGVDNVDILSNLAPFSIQSFTTAFDMIKTGVVSEVEILPVITFNNEEVTCTGSKGKQEMVEDYQSSCREILNNGFGTGDGIYTIDIDGQGGSDPLMVYCDMTYNGGGWTLLMKATRGVTFNYDSNYWTNANTLNENDATRNDADAKYRSFNELPITDIMARWPDAGDIRWLRNSAWTARTALTGFNEFRNWGNPLVQPDWNPTYFSAQSGNKAYGTKLKDLGGQNSGARWGYRWNNEADWGSDDVGGGVGQWAVNSAWRYSAGDWSNCCRSSTGMLRSARVEVYGR